MNDMENNEWTENETVTTTETTPEPQAAPTLVVYQEVELSLTESLVPTIVHVKQFDHKARKIRCRLYRNNVEYPIPEDVILTCFGTRPDGKLFQYGSDSTPDLIFSDNGNAIVTLTDFMTAVHGRFPVDISLISSDGDVLSSFRLVLRVEPSAVKNGKLAVLTFEKCLETTIDNIASCFITEDGYFGVYSDNGLDLKEGSFSGTATKVEEELAETLVNSSVNNDGIGVYESADHIGLNISVDEEGNLVVLFGKDAEDMKNN